MPKIFTSSDGTTPGTTGLNCLKYKNFTIKLKSPDGLLLNEMRRNDDAIITNARTLVNTKSNEAWLKNELGNLVTGIVRN